MKVLLLILAVSLLSACNKTSSTPPLKGYELYSWVENDKNYFCLIAGTNRTKTVEELVKDSYEKKDGWIHIKVSGIESIKKELKELAKKSFVSWGGSPSKDYKSINPDTESDLKTYCKSLELDLAD